MPTTTAANDDRTLDPLSATALVDSTIEALFSALPVGLTPAQSAAAATRVTRTVVKQPRALARHVARLCREQARVLVGNSDIAPERGDRRFDDDTYRSHPIYKRVGQSYLAWNRQVYALLDDLGLDAKSKERARFLLGLYTETIAPNNTLLGNPAAIRKAVETRGRSVGDGLRHMRYDLLHNGGLPSMVDTRPFQVGDTMAATPGDVVFRNDVLELIHYAPQTDEVYARPLLFVPPQINRYYILDLAPGRSVVEHAVQSGQQVFMISWRNADEDMRDWDLDTYLEAIEEAIGAILAITQSQDLNLIGVCAGGITTAALLAHFAATGDNRVNCASFLVTILDFDKLTTVGTFLSGPTVAASIRRTQRRGVLSGRDLGRLFAWLRPNDLIWNYWVNNYLLGQHPPAFDVLAWNADSTDMPAGLHADFMHIAGHNALTERGGIDALGTPVDLGSIAVDTFVVGAVNDHLTPWEGCYETTRLLGGTSTFILSNAGHIVAMVNPPGSSKSSYQRNDAAAGTTDAVTWREGSETVTGTWWDAWTEWLAERSGDFVVAPTRTGDDDHVPILAAPGTYVRA